MLTPLDSLCFRYMWSFDKTIEEKDFLQTIKIFDNKILQKEMNMDKISKDVKVCSSKQGKFDKVALYLHRLGVDDEVLIDERTVQKGNFLIIFIFLPLQ